MRQEDTDRARTDAINDMIKALVEREGGYVFDPDDSGGETKYGITATTARKFGYLGDMRNLPLSFAVKVYRQNYWDAVMGDQLLEASALLCERVFDCSVLCGPKRASTILQQCLNLLNRQEDDYSDIAEDGIIGKVTISTLLAHKARNNSTLRLSQLYLMRYGSYLADRAQARPANEKFLMGWMNRLAII